MHWLNYKEKNLALYNYIKTTERRAVDLSRIQAFGYNLDCVLERVGAYTTTRPELNVDVDISTFKKEYGLDRYEIYSAIEKGIGFGFIKEINYDKEQLFTLTIHIGIMNAILNAVEEDRLRAEIEAMKNEPREV